MSISLLYKMLKKLCLMGTLKVRNEKITTKNRKSDRIQLSKLYDWVSGKRCIRHGALMWNEEIYKTDRRMGVIGRFYEQFPSWICRKRGNLLIALEIQSDSVAVAVGTIDRNLISINWIDWIWPIQSIKWIKRWQCYLLIVYPPPPPFPSTSLTDMGTHFDETFVWFICNNLDLNGNTNFMGEFSWHAGKVDLFYLPNHCEHV